MFDLSHLSKATRNNFFSNIDSENQITEKIYKFFQEYRIFRTTFQSNGCFKYGNIALLVNDFPTTLAIQLTLFDG